MILERPVGNTVINGAQLIEELHPEPWLFVLIPLECRFHIKVDGRLRDQPIFDHLGFLAFSAK